MTLHPSIPALTAAIALTSASPAPAQDAPGSVRDFRLPPAEAPAREPPSRAQGPVDTEGPVRRAPRVIPTEPAPTENGEPARSQADTARPPAREPAAADPRPVPRQSDGNRRIPAPTRATPRQNNSPPQPRIRAPEETASLPSSAIPTGASTQSASEDLPSERVNLPGRAPATMPTAQADFDDPTSAAQIPTWWWAAFLAFIAAIGVVLALYIRRRQAVPASASERDIVPNQEPVPSEPATAAIPASVPARARPSPPPRIPIQIKAEARNLSRSLMFATLNYSLDLRNLGTQPLRDVIVRADMVTAHGQAPLEQQLAGRDDDVTPAATIPTIAAQDTHRYDGEYRLPMSEVRIIAQGDVRLYVPLLRIRIETEGKVSLMRSFVIGILPASGQGKLQPFRRDEMAQTYRNIGLRLLD
ncbi:MAG: hypothetical protein WA948_06915 [Pontixanthobacter sp.]